MIKLSEPEIKRREVLVDKFQHNTITYQEAEELKRLLDREKQEASDLGNFVVFLGITFLIGLVISFLTEKDKKKRKKRFVFF